MVITTKKISLALIACLVFLSALLVTTESASAEAFEKMPQRLPEDSYLLKQSGTNNTATSPSNDCPAGNRCYTDDYQYLANGERSHQYITITNASVNDDSRNGERVSPSTDSRYAKTQELFIYTRKPGSNVAVRLQVVSRALGNKYSCGNQINVHYYNPATNTPYDTEPGIAGKQNLKTVDTPVYTRASDGKETCEKDYFVAESLPAYAYEEIFDNSIPSKSTGIYRTKIVLQFDTRNSRSDPTQPYQTSFQAVAGLNAKLGYVAGGTNREGKYYEPISSPSDGIEHGWVNQYPTNLANGHRMTFYFRPPCDTTVGTKFNIAWDDVNTGNSDFQPPGVDPRIIVYRYIPDQFNQQHYEDTRRKVMDAVNANDNQRIEDIKTAQRNGAGLESVVKNVGDSDMREYGTKNYGERQTYAYLVEFENIYGGNGISFLNPFNSADARIPCPPTEGQSGVSCSEIAILGQPQGRYYKIYVNDNGSSADIGGTPDYQGKLPAAGAYHNLVNDNKIVQGTLEYTVIVYNGADDSTGRAYEQRFSVGPCFQAKCDLDVVESPWAPPGSNAVEAGKKFGVIVYITNTGVNNLPKYLGGFRLAGVIQQNGKWNAPDGDSWDGWGGLAPAYIDSFTNNDEIYANGGVGARYFELDAPDDINSHPLKLNPAYWGKLGLGEICNTEVETYKRYDFKAEATTTLSDPESPKEIKFSTPISKTGTEDITGTSTRKYYKTRNGVNNLIPGFGPFIETRTFESVPYSETYGVPEGSYELGDGWCAEINLDRGHGWKGPRDYINEAPEFATDCDNPNEVVDQPYVRAYGEDVAAGGGFGAQCSRTNSRIQTFLRPLSEHNGIANKSGSGSQLASFALGNISGFTSASTRDATPTAESWRGLTFANDNPNVGSINTVSHNPLLGGNMSGDGWCAPDYYTATQFVDTDTKKKVSTSTAPINIMSLTDGEQTVRNINNGKVILLGPGAPVYNRKHTLYVDGDVFIRDNVMYQGDYSGGVNSIPSFTVVARGNIYIDNDVTQLDGLYIAQPKEGRANTGRIYTCGVENSDGVVNGPLVSPSSIYTHCGANNNNNPARQLRVNGAFIAERVVLNRAGFSLRDSDFREQANTSQAAEIFNFSQEMYLSPPVFRPNSTSTSGDYQYISIMAPIL